MRLQARLCGACGRLTFRSETTQPKTLQRRQSGPHASSNQQQLAAPRSTSSRTSTSGNGAANQQKHQTQCQTHHHHYRRLAPAMGGSIISIGDLTLSTSPATPSQPTPPVRAHGRLQTMPGCVCALARKVLVCLLTHQPLVAPARPPSPRPVRTRLRCVSHHPSVPACGARA